MAGRWWGRLRGRGRQPAPAAGPPGSSSGGGVPGGGAVPGHGGGGGGPDPGALLVAADMFTPGRAGGQEVLVWEGSVAAPDSPLAWHSRVAVEVFFHTGHHDSTRELAGEFTRQLDRQLCALSLLSAERLLEGIRAYRTQGRQPTSKATRDARKSFMRKVVYDLTRVHQLSDEEAAARTLEVDRALVVLHESDQVTYGPSQPATTKDSWPSLGHGAVNSSVGGQNKPMAAVLEQAALQVLPEHRAHVRLLVRAVLTSSPALAQDLRHGRTRLEPRTQAQRAATSPRAPPWTPSHVAATVAADRAPWDPPPPAQEPSPPARGGPPPADAAAGARVASLREASFPHPPTAAVRTPPVREGAPPRTGGPGQPSRPLTREEILADIEARAVQPAQARTSRQAPTRKHRRNRGLGR